MIINAGLVRVVYAGAYPDANSVAFLAQAGVALQKFDLHPS
jgi:deoxycytidylate deaminase